MSYLVKQSVTARDEVDETHNHAAGSVVSDFELTQHIKDQIGKGVTWYTQRFEPLTEKEARAYRVKATSVEGKRLAPGGQIVDPPFDDYVGLHPDEVIRRMEDMKPDEVERLRLYERAGMNRESIIEYTAPSEKEPFNNYDNMGVKDILDKMSLFDQDTNNTIILYEMAHQRRPAIIEFSPDEYETSDDEKDEEQVLALTGSDNKE